MYFAPAHREADLRVLHQLIRDHPLGIITTGIPSATHPFLQVSHVPFVLDVADASDATELGRLRCHMTRANAQSQAMMEAAQARPELGNMLEQEVLIVFTSPDHYVTPKLYTETKPATGKVVPTWNYAAAQVYGRAKVYFDKSAETAGFLATQLADLSQQSETGVMGYTGGNAPRAWQLSDAPERYIELLTKGIIGLEIEITRLEGKFKMSQDKPLKDRQGIIQGFSGLQTEGAVAVGTMIKERSEMKERDSQKV